MPIKIKKSSIKYKDSNGNMQDVGLPLGSTQTDTSLTQSGVAADAKVTGDAIEQIREQINENTNNGTDLTGYATETYVKNYAQPKGTYLTSVPSEYVTDSELNAKGYLTSIPSEYVTESELSTKNYATKSEIPTNNVVYGTCDTAAATAEKVVTISNSDNWKLSVGTVVMIYFSVSNSASSVKLNVNNTGAYPIWYNNAEYTSTGTAYTGYAKRVIKYMFNGTHWVWIGSSYDANSTYTNVALGHGYATCSTAEATTAKVGTLSSYALTVGGITAVKFTYAVPANSTLNINSKGAKNIFYRGAKITANVIKAGDIATFIYDGTQYQLMSIDRWQNDISQLEASIADQNAIIDGKQPIGNYLTEIPSEYITETELDAELEDFKKQSIQQTPLFANSVEDMTDTSKVYVLKGTNEIWGYMLTEKEVATGGYTNRLKTATEAYNGTSVYGDPNGYVTGVRLSSSSGSTSTGTATTMLTTGFISVKDASGNPTTLDGARIRTQGFTSNGAEMQSYVITYNASGTKIAHYVWASEAGLGNDYIKEFTLDSATYGTGIKYIRISASCKGSTFPSVVTVNEEIKEGGTTTETVEAWASTGFTFVPADYEERIVELERKVKKSSNVQNSLGISEVFAPSPQLPADGSETADFNGDWDYITAEHIYTYIDALLNLYPRYITKEVMGKDASGSHDWCRYVCSRRAYDAWQKPNYPPMYAWVNGSTVIYSVSVSPRIGDTLYTTKYVGTSKGTVSSVSNANQTRTVGGVVYTRDKSKDVEPTLVYTETGYSPYFSSNYKGTKNGVYDSNKSKISTISSMSNGTLTGANGVTYTRYPLGDRNSRFEEIPAIVIGGNEHGTGGDPATPAMISARMVKDLCECKNMDNPFLNLLKNEYMVVFCPVVNPWGLHKNNKSYYNSNGVNLDRNLDTIGWGNCPTYPNAQGAYGGSENEMQYFMNTLVASKCKVAMCNHSYGHGLDSTTGEAVSGGICSYMMGRNKTKYTESLLKIAEVMACNYNLVFTDNGEAPPEQWAKTRSYFESIGVDGVALEINSRDGFITDSNNDGEGKQFTSRVMEAGYTQLLQALYMLISKLD